MRTTEISVLPRITMSRSCTLVIGRLESSSQERRVSLNATHREPRPGSDEGHESAASHA